MRRQPWIYSCYSVRKLTNKPEIEADVALLAEKNSWKKKKSTVTRILAKLPTWKINVIKGKFFVLDVVDQVLQDPMICYL